MKKISLVFLLVTFSLIISACTTPTPEVVEVEKIVTQVIKETVIVEGTPQVVEKEVTVEVDKVVTATPEAEEPEAQTEEPSVGGTLVWAISNETNTLDAHHSLGGSEGEIGWMLGAGLVIISPGGEIVPWLAESYTVSDDGLVYTFKLKSGLKFSDGSGLTAHDYVYTFERATDPETASEIAGGNLSMVESFEALDDLTLQLTLSEPYFSLLYSLSEPVYMMPLSQSWVEEWGDDYGRHPMSAGMYKFKEWVQGEKIVLEHNSDYAWGPEFSHGGPPYVENIEFLYIPEYATIIAGLEAGEIDFARINEIKDVQRIRDTGNYDILETVYNGAGPYLAMNVSMPPFDDIRVRKAFNMAADRDALIQLVALGEAVPQYGPLSAGVIGYNPNADVLGAELYSFDLEAAKALMAEAGWVDNDGDGIVEKDSQPLELTMGIMAGRADMQKTGEILQEQLRALGVDVEIEIQEMGIVIDNTIGGNFELSVFAYDMAEFDFSFILFMSQAANLPNHNDPELDELLIKSRTTVDPAERQEIVNETQEYIVEQAYQVSLFAPKVFCAINKRVKDYVWSPPGGAFGQTPFFDNAYISE